MSVPVYNHYEEAFTIYSPQVKGQPTSQEQVSNTGEVMQIVFTVGMFPGDSITCTLNVLDENGVVLFTSGAKPPGSSTVFWPYSSNKPFCVSGGADKSCQVQFVLSGPTTNSGGGTVMANMFIKA
jgi:hypothetical protein